MLDEKDFNAVAVFASGYAKRILDQHYDKLEDTDVGRKLKALDPKLKYGIEAGLYALMTYVDQKFVANTPLKKFVKEVIKDAPPEIAKRMLSDLRADLSSDAAHSTQPEGRTALECLLSLDDAALASMLGWIASVAPADAQHTAQSLARLSPEQLRRFASLNPEQKALILNQPKLDPVPAVPRRSMLADLDSQLKKARAAVQKQTAKTRNA